MKNSTLSEGLEGWLLYDASCGVCRRWVPFFGNTLKKIGLDFAPLQEDWVKERLKLSDEDLLKDIRLLLFDGTSIQGADVYRYAMKRIWWAYPIYILSIMPFLNLVFDWAYRTFAKYRYRISGSC